MNNSNLFSPTKSGMMVYLPFILLLVFASIISEASEFGFRAPTELLQDTVKNRKVPRLPIPPTPPKAPVKALPAPPSPPPGATVELPPPPVPPSVPEVKLPAPPAPPKAPAKD